MCVIGDCECVHVCMEYDHLGPVQVLRESILYVLVAEIIFVLVITSFECIWP